MRLATITFLAALNSSYELGLVDEENPENKNPAKTPDNTRLTFSVGASRGAARVEVKPNDLSDMITALTEKAPEAITPADVIRRTMVRNEDGSVSFATSLKKNSRTCTVPAGEWDGFIASLRNVETSLPGFIEEFLAEKPEPAPAPQEGQSK